MTRKLSLPEIKLPKLPKLPKVRLPRSRGIIHSVAHAGVTVTDFEAAVKWYHERFGFYLVSEDWLTGDAAAALFPLYQIDDLNVRMGFLATGDGSVLEVFQFTPALEAQATVWNRPGYTHIALSVTNVPALVDRLRGQGEEFLIEPQQTSGAAWVFFRDPDGNLIELIDTGSNRLPLKYLGRLVGSAFKRGKFAEYYR